MVCGGNLVYSLESCVFNEPEMETQSFRDDLYCSMFENVIEDQMLINYSQKVVAKESKLSVRSVTPYTKTQVNFLNGNQFFGDINECRMNGNGRYLWADDGSLYEGEFKRPNVIEGQGAFKFRNQDKQTGSSKYCGSFVDGSYHGKGQLTNSFFKYDGNFDHGKFHGKGNLKSGLESFDGNFSNDKKICGKRVYVDGIFVGDFHDDGTRRFGKYEFENGDVYFGSFDAGKFSGYGEYFWSCKINTEVSYAGQWRSGYRDGLGVLKVDGTTCVTVFHKNLKTGPAVAKARNGRVFASTKMFQNDEFLGCTEIDIQQDNIETLRKLINPTELNVDSFIKTVKELVDEPRNSQQKVVYPFHVNWFHMEVQHIAIWDFVKQFPDTNQDQEFTSIQQTITEFIPIFEEVYNRYKNFSSTAVVKDPPSLLRVGLWQLMHDLELFKKSERFNSREILEEADREFNIFSLDPDDGFESVSIAQMVQYVMYITLFVNKHHDYVLSCAINQRSKVFGLFGTMLVIFVREFLCPMKSFNGMIPKLMQENPAFYTSFLNTIDLKHHRDLSVRDVFKIFETWQNGKASKREKEEEDSAGVVGK